MFRSYTLKVTIDTLGLKPDILKFSVCFLCACSPVSLFLPSYGLFEHSLVFQLDLFIVIFRVLLYIVSQWLLWVFQYI